MAHWISNNIRDNFAFMDPDERLNLSDIARAMREIPYRHSVAAFFSTSRIFLFSAFIYLLLMGYWIVPKYFTDFANDPKIANSPEVEAARREVLKEGSEDPTSVRVVKKAVEIPINLMVNGSAEIIFAGRDGTDLRVTTHLRVDVFILFTGIWAVVTMAVGVLLRMRTVLESNFQALVDSKTGTDKQQTAETFLTNDVNESKARAIDLYSRSNLMLVAGVIMAFIGVAVFYVSLPQYPSNETRADYLIYLARSIRPVGILIFLEGIAWFLLRQYRALIEDYKAFHRLYLKRANYLVALKTLTVPNVSESQMLLAASMLAEDLTGRLKSGETTENLEGVKSIEPNPVFAILQSVMESVKKKG